MTDLLPDPAIPNPLTPETKRAVRTFLSEHLDAADHDLARGPRPEDLAALDVDQDSWTAILTAFCADARRLRDLLDVEEVAWSDLTRLRQILELSPHPDRALQEATAAVDAAAETGTRARIAAYQQHQAHVAATRGYTITNLLPVPEPHARPMVSFTTGLASHGHDDLLIAGLPPDTAVAVLTDLADTILAGARTLAPADVLTDVLGGGYALKVRQLTPGQASAAGLDRDTPALQLLFPDIEHRFPGDPGCDPDYERNQTLPSDPSPEA